MRALGSIATLTAVVLLGSVSAEEESWDVVCNMDCEGVNTCMEKQLCVGEEVENGACPDNPDCPVEDNRCPPVECRWEAWQEWENDGISGLCTRKRDFTPNRCGGRPCIGTIADTMYCDPIKKMSEMKDCKFSEWSEWTACDPKTLQRSRDRFVATDAAHGGRPCEGPLTLTEPCGVREEPVDCELGEWMAWSGCSQECGGGQQLRIRSIKTQALRGGKLCGVGADSDSRVLQWTRSCNTQSCSDALVPQDCLLGGWSDWSECHKDGMQRYREREVVRPGAHGGMPCQSELKEAAACEIENHTVIALDCKLSDWGPWTLCSRTCEGGQTQRQREIEVHAANGGAPCEDTTEETVPCNDFACSVDPESRDCSLSTWSEWSECSADCGQGLQRRSRSVRVLAIEGGIGCNDPLEEIRLCADSKPCDHDDCEWGHWSGWGLCSQSCGGGYRSRNRTVTKHPSRGGDPCDALDSIKQIESCNTKPCFLDCIDGLWAAWDEWSECSRTCGPGMSWRSRRMAIKASPCGQPVEGETTEARQCNEDVCEEDVDCQLGDWEGWDECSKSCDGVHARKRSILVPGRGAGQWCGNGTDPLMLEQVRSCNGAKDFMGREEEDGVKEAMEKCGFVGHEPVDCELADWDSWSSCSATCDGGQRNRKRKIKALPRNGGKPCDGAMQEVGACGAEPCIAPEDCRWDSWSEWGDCTRCDGERTRTRMVASHANSNGQACAPSDSEQVERCDECPAVKTLYCVWDDYMVGECSVSCGTNGWRKKVRQIKSYDRLEAIPADRLDFVVGNATGDNASCEGSEVDYIKCDDMPSCNRHHCTPQDCVFNDWSDWQDPEKCEGLCKRERSIQRHADCHGMQCLGSLVETKECLKEECAATKACQFSEWSGWTQCAAGASQRTRERSIESLAGPEGEACEGILQETAACDNGVAEEAADCKLSEWGEWASCSRSCGGGHQERSRQVMLHATGGGKPCNDTLRLMRSCNEGLCGQQAADCVLGEWEDWTGCDGKDGGQAIRKRSMTVAKGDGRPCSSSILEAGSCPLPEKTDCKWGEWAQWGECGRDCGGGQRFRTREIVVDASNGGTPCEGDLGETESCNEGPCSEIDCHVSEWSSWSACETNCGQGQQLRKRHVIQAAQPGGNGCQLGLVEARGCTGEGGPCDGDRACEWDAWSEWSACFKAEFCGVGYRRRSRDVAHPAEGLGGRCPAIPIEEVQPSATCPGSCDSRSCIDAEWDNWGPWDECSVTCGAGGVRSRSRVLRVQANECGKPAEGESREYKNCHSEIPCETTGPLIQQDCIFGGWTAWEPPECPAACNGEQRRTRTIVRYSANGGRPCEGATSEITRCNPGPGEKDPPGCQSGAPVDCVVEQWSLWSECSAECGTGHKARRRVIAQPPKFGGMACENPLEEIRECNASKPCVDWSVDCELADWQEWTRCDPLTGQKTRARAVARLKVGFGNDCEGSRFQVTNCTRECQDTSYKCGWAPWSSWSQCSATCGPEGRRTRVRRLQLGGAAPAAAVTAVAAAPAAAPAAVPALQEKDAALLTKYSELSERLTAASARRRQDLLLAFAGGLAAFAVVMGFVRRFGTTSQTTAEARTARRGPLSTPLTLVAPAAPEAIGVVVES